LKGRINVLGKVRKDMKNISGKVVWMHCASLGEYEQGKPVIENILKEYPELTPVISFFSPSGYEIVKKKNVFPYVYYLPMDSFVNAQLWLKFVKPSLVLWVKYEYWYFYLQAIHRRRIPLLMVSGVYNRDQVFFKWYGGLYRKMLHTFSHFFVQNRSSKRFLASLITKEKITVSGDTRCDRVIEIANLFSRMPAIEKFIADKRSVVCGSTWEADQDIWVHYVKAHPGTRFIIAPHEIDKENIRFVKNTFANSITYSDWLQMIEINETAPQNINCLIIDNIGMLSKLYFYADITYVGGGFGGDGLHNILEAAVYNKPVIFGPYIYKNFEASELINAGGGISISSAIELEKVLNELFSNIGLITQKGEHAGQYVRTNAGASKRITDFIIAGKLI